MVISYGSKMMFWAVFGLLTVSGLSLARLSPNADSVDQLIANARTARISDNVYEDARLDVPDLVRKYNYTLEQHTVITDDGYILEMHRIPHGRDQNNRPDPNKPIVFLMHGLLSSSADWVLMGPHCAFAYILAEEGFDVWMGNARGNYYSRKHLRYNPDALWSTTYWRFSWEEIGTSDLPAMIDHVLEYTGQSRVHYIGHSQGTTAFFVMGAMRPEYNRKIISMHAMAPVAYMANNRNLFLRFIAQYAHNIDLITSMMGIGEFLPNSNMMTWAGQAICRDEVQYQPICYNILFLIGGWNEDQLNSTMLPVKFGHTPAGASTRQFAHYGQGISDKRFRRYDYGRITNLSRYGRINPPAYDLRKVTAPVFLHYSTNDPLAHVKDVDRLWKELGRPVGKFRVPDNKFNHLDFMWAIDAKPLIYDRIINLLNAVGA